MTSLARHVGSRSRAFRPAARWIAAASLGAATLLLSGCGNGQIWGAKSSGSPATLGGSLNIPLGGTGGKR